MPIQGYVDAASRTEVTGWAIDWDQPTTPVDILIVVNGIEVGKCKADGLRDRLQQALGGASNGRHEFRFRFPKPLDIYDVHNLEIRADPGNVLLTNGRRSFFPERHGHSRFTPVILTSSGRSGTTMLIQEFSTHPEMVVANSYPFEVKLTSYYAAALSVLSANTFVPGQVESEFALSATRDQIIGRNPWNRPSLLNNADGQHAAQYISRTFPSRLANLFRETIEEYYGLLADESGGRSGVHLFAEKGVLEEPVRQAVRQMFGPIKEIVMVRDPRDYLCSANKFWKHDIEAAMNAMRSEFPLIMNIRREAASDVHVVRYEDLILDPVNARKSLYKFVGCSGEFEARIVDRNAVPFSHRTSKSPAESIGRYKSELDQQTLNACKEHLGGFMDMFGYT